MKSAIFAFSCFLICCQAWAQTKNFVSTENEFSLVYPGEFEIVSSALNAALVLRHKTQGYPSFNIVVQPGTYKALAQSDEKQKQAILNDYNKVGITDASPIHSFFARIGERNAYTLEIEYSSQNERYISSVTITSGKGKYYVLTYIDRADKFSANRELRNFLLDNFKLWGSQSQPNMPNHGGSPFSFLILAALIIIIGFLSYFFIWPKLTSRK